jgi:DNA-binding MarR family transcriptional regulator
MSIISNVRDANERPEFESGTGFLLARLGSLAARSWRAFLAERGLTQVQYATLMVLAERGPLGQLRLAQLVGVDARNLVGVLDRLAARGLIVRETDTDDRRRRNVRLTASGGALVRDIASDAAHSRDQFLGALNIAERRQLNARLRQLYQAHAHEPEQGGDPNLAPGESPRGDTRAGMKAGLSPGAA